ncbi:unnamed protein product [Leptosia nina]|uniref:PiggyBac transposable element-derived protein domain-containing protein n=1 Tax=Leptosia nina TaxID=320188 RepID=A0AAV1JG70_9NEOP
MDGRLSNGGSNRTNEAVTEHANNFIETLPKMPSHYCRKDSNRLYFPEDFFKISYNIDFHVPKKDKCVICVNNKEESGEETEKRKLQCALPADEVDADPPLVIDNDQNMPDPPILEAGEAVPQSRSQGISKRPLVWRKRNLVTAEDSLIFRGETQITEALMSYHPDYDRLFKIRPLEEMLNCQFGKVPLDQRLSIDEQMCATKMSHYIKQYMPNKPHKWGFKLYLICSLQGYAHRFEVYSGGGSKNNILPGEPDLGESRNTVVRGFYEENVATVDDIDVSAVVWKDNKPVNLLSIYVGAEPATTVTRFDKLKKERVAIPCSKVIKEYNAHMGGVDLLDSFIGRYHITMKSRKWTMRLFYHFLDLAVINSWVMFKKVNNIKGNDQLLNLGTFRLELAETLCKLGLPANGAKRGRPSGSTIQRELVMKKFRGPAQAIPLKDVRLDQTCHWAVWLDKQQSDKKNFGVKPGLLFPDQTGRKRENGVTRENWDRYWQQERRGSERDGYDFRINEGSRVLERAAPALVPPIRGNSFSTEARNDYKYQMAISKLGREALQQVSDIVFTPPEANKYNVLKERLLKVYEESPERQFQRLVSEMELGSQKPTQLLRRMKDLARNCQASDETVLRLWMARMPPSVRPVLSACQDQTTDNLATIADKVIESLACSNEMAEVSSSNNSPQVCAMNEMMANMSKLTMEIAALRGRMETA